MLILTRRPGETIVIGESVEVIVMAVAGNQVRLGVKAPKDVIVDREEIAQRKEAEKKASPHGRGCRCSWCRQHAAARPA